MTRNGAYGFVTSAQHVYYGFEEFRLLEEGRERSTSANQWNSWLTLRYNWCVYISCSLDIKSKSNSIWLLYHGIFFNYTLRRLWIESDYRIIPEEYSLGIMYREVATVVLNKKKEITQHRCGNSRCLGYDHLSLWMTVIESLCHHRLVEYRKYSTFRV